MDMLSGEEITDAGLTDWRKLGQGLHARFIVGDFASGARFVTAIAAAAEQVGHSPEVRMGLHHVDLKLISDDAIYPDDEGTEHRVEWVTQQDVAGPHDQCHCDGAGTRGRPVVDHRDRAGTRHRQRRRAGTGVGCPADRQW